MIDTLPHFLQEAKKGMADKSYRAQLNANISNYQNSFKSSVQHFSNLELAKMRAARLRWKTIDHLDKYLIEFESNFIKAGGKVHWAIDLHDVVGSVNNILKKKNIASLLYDVDRYANELSIHESLKSDSLNIIEINNGANTAHHEAQLISNVSEGEPDSQYNKKQNGLKKEYNLSAMAAAIRIQKRTELLQADAGISTAQFFIADPGAIVIGDDDGASLFSSCLPKISIILAPIDRIVPTIGDIDTMLSLYAIYKNCAPQLRYNTLLTGPRTADDKDGPVELHIILIDNGRSNVLAHQPQRKVLSCIECNACLPASAIYKTVGGKSYPGPAKAVSIPLAFGPEKYKYLADLATLDGSGSEACPVKISFPKLTLENRRLFIEQGSGSRIDKLYYFAWKKAMLKRDIFNIAGIDSRKKIMEFYFIKTNEGLRSWPKTTAKSFNQQWREKMVYK